MKNELKKIPFGFDPDSRVWVYQSTRGFSEKENIEINEQLHQFYVQWKAHELPIRAWAGVLFDHFIVVVADEVNSTKVSGCATDNMVRIIKSIERQYQVQLFDRLTLSFLVHEKVEMLPYNQVQYALKEGFIQTDTLLFDNLVDTLNTLKSTWLKPLHQSWLWSRIKEVSV